ncbi:MAG: indole-3-glycerol phosphate synthase TrpC [Vicinamibacteria bacterium]
MTFLDEVLAVKRREVETLHGHSFAEASEAPKGFASALRAPGLAVIAEIKRRSPSKGLIAPDLDAAATAEAYAKGGAAAISCLTDREFFGAQSDDFARVRAAGLPVLRKDFIIDELQIDEARAMGASAILLIVRILEPSTLERLLRRAASLGLDALVEVHSEKEVEVAVSAGASIIGVNNRDLATLVVDSSLALRLRARIPAGVLTVAESGVKTRDDVRQIEDAGFDAVLIGESLATHADPAAKLRALTGQDHGVGARR